MNFQVDVLASRVRLRFLKMWSDFVSTVMNEASQLVFRVCMAIFLSYTSEKKLSVKCSRKQPWTSHPRAYTFMSLN